MRPRTEEMASLSSKTLRDLYPPVSKRLKPNVTPICKSVTSQSNPDSDANTNESPQSSILSVKQKSRIECNKLLAKSKRNLKICADRVSSWEGHVKLENLLVEETWLEALPGEFQKPYAKNLCQFVGREICNGSEAIYPPSHMIFNALNSTPFDKVKAVILGQDPYHGPGQAMGLSFSVPVGVKVPSSLVNIFKELKQDLGCSVPSHGNLEKWTSQGVLLLNAVLTGFISHAEPSKTWIVDVAATDHRTSGSIKLILMQKRVGNSLLMLLSEQSHKRRKELCFSCGGTLLRRNLGTSIIRTNWTYITTISHISEIRLIDKTKHHILKAAHPSGLSANRGFFGCRHFSKTNQLLEQMGISPIDWELGHL